MAQKLQSLIVVDEMDHVVQYASREECHLGGGLPHRALSILLFSPQNRVLLQLRKSGLFDGLWDFACATFENIKAKEIAEPSTANIPKVL